MPATEPRLAFKVASGAVCLLFVFCFLFLTFPEFARVLMFPGFLITFLDDPKPVRVDLRSQNDEELGIRIAPLGDTVINHTRRLLFTLVKHTQHDLTFCI